ncbi:MAG: hypothetical protein V8S42_01670 [Lachnospiraceae bacterium]
MADEIKSEAQVNAAVEDTAVNNTEVESTNTDTVEWVESTRTLIEGTEKSEDSYEKVSPSDITDPAAKTAAGFRLLSRKLKKRAVEIITVGRLRTRYRRRLQLRNRKQQRHRLKSLRKQSHRR